MNIEHVRKLGLGSVQFGIPYGISNELGQTSENEVSIILKYAREIGINLIDTASVYGISEKVLGNNDLSGFNIVSKFLLQNDNKTITQQLQLSLANLKLESLFGYMSHRPLEIVNNTELWNELIDLKEIGLVEKIGFSFNEVHEIENILNLGINPDIIQVPYNYLDIRFEPYMIDLKNRGCEIHTRSAFLQGLFFADVSKLSDFFNDIKPIIQQLQTFGNFLPAMLIKHCIDKPFIDKVIFGVNTQTQLKNNVENLFKTDVLPLNNVSINETILIPSKWPK